jgi:hypothetical protein
MDLTTVVIWAVVALVIVAILTSAVRAWRFRPPQLKPLPDESRSRYVAAWDRIEARFVDAPEEAVREADSVVMSVLSERGHPLGTDRLPSRYVRARRMAMAKEGRSGTEDLRRAMLDYRAIFDQMVGSEHREQARNGRREIA